MNKQNKGITLIALVITIIILVILVGVTVSVTINTGLIANSKKVVADYDNAQTNEKAQVQTVYDIMESMDSKSLAANVKVGDYVEYIPEKGKSIISYKGSFQGSEDENISYEQIAIINENGEAIGKGVQGNGHSNQTFQVPTDEAELEKIKWRVLSIEDGKVNLVAEKTIGYNGISTGHTDQELHLAGMTGYAYAEKEINAVCSIYGTGAGAEGARSINIEDVNKTTGYNVTKDSEFKDVYGTIDGWADRYRWKNSLYTYSYNKEGLNLKTANINSVEYSLIFKPAEVEFFGYLIPSRTINVVEDGGLKGAFFGNLYISASGIANFERWIAISDGSVQNVSGIAGAVRPVVTLKSNVKAGELKIGDNGERIWEIVVPTES